MQESITFTRGKNRIKSITSLPCIDIHSHVKYEGSISKCGDNADWDWGMYKDENGEWVLMEADGAGCIYNFTQHRYPTSEVPTFKFYFDNNPTAQFEIKPSEFGTKPPFLKPLADKFVGPEDNGRGPIWVVRSFVPMEFTTHCKVTSTIKLEGAQKDLGEGGWGHITYHLYDSAEGLKTFCPDDLNKIFEDLDKAYCIPAQLTESLKDFTLKPNEGRLIFNDNLKAAVCNISAEAEFSPEILSSLWITAEFDGQSCVEAPFGTFFGCEYGKTPADIKTSMLRADLINGKFENRFPMPFFESAKICIENRSDTDITIKKTSVSVNTELNYDKNTTGLFRSSDYYPKTANTDGKNSVIADIYGNGQMVYGVISGEDIACGCEGDVRVFIDGLRSPCVESDGSESWGSYGWGFVCPPQCNPFSAYNGVPDINDTWSELRLTFTDCYYFKNNLRFELEHGCQNDGGGYHSGQIFYYSKPEIIKNELEISPNSEYYISNGTKCEICDRFENGIHENYESFTLCENITESVIKIPINPINCGLVIKRVCLQKSGRMEAKIYINGRKVTERNWLFPDSNEIYSLLEDDFLVPSHYTKGIDSLEIKIVPISSNWNECNYIVNVLSEDN